MGNLIGLLYNWQQLIGALVGAIVTISGAVGLNNYLITKAERKKQYSNLLLVLWDLKFFVARCENYLNSNNKQMVSFTHLFINDKIDYIAPSQVFDLNPKVYGSIQAMYNIAQVIKYNLGHSEAVTTIVKKSKGKEIHTQDNVISGRYHYAMGHVQFRLKGIYRDFNFIAKEIKNLSKKHGYLSFPGTITFYKEDYVKEKIKEYGLK